MGTLLTILLFIILFFWIVGRVLPLMLSWWVKRKLNRFGNQQGSSGFSNGKQRKNKIIDKNVGEYVDFVETKEDD
ncbi:MAG: hypothetical protein ABFC18_02005 [Rikenellaceae bacterium]|jgi:hypothetical protein